MRYATTIAAMALFLALAGTASAGDATITIGEWRTEGGKSLVCGGEEGHTLVNIATRANEFYAGGAQRGSPEYETYWSTLEKAIHERRCFVTEKMRHMPDSLVYSGPETLEAQGKRFKVIGTTIEQDGDTYPAFTMTTLEVEEAH